MKITLFLSLFLLAGACVQKEPVRVNKKNPLESNTLIDIPEEFQQEEASKKMKGFICEMSSSNGLEEVFLQFTLMPNGERRLHVRRLQEDDVVDPLYPVIDGFRLLPVSLRKETHESLSYDSEAEIVDDIMISDLPAEAARAEVKLNREGKSFAGTINISASASNGEKTRVNTMLSELAVLEKCTGPKSVKMGTK